MKQYLAFLLLLTTLFIGKISCFAQQSAMFYQNFVLANHKIYVFHADSTLKVFDDENGKLIDSFSPNPKIKLLLQDDLGAPVIVDAKNQVKRLENNQKWVTVSSFEEGNLYRVIFDNDNNCYLITNKGIVNAKTRVAYMPGKNFYHSESALRGGEAFHSMDDDVSTYVDSDNNLWVFFSHGEWGDDMFIFNTKNCNFIPLASWIATPSYEANNHLFSVITNEFNTTYVVQYDKIYGANQVISLFKGKAAYTSTEDPTFPGSIRNLDFFLAAYTYKKSENCFYFITSKGLNKVNITTHNIKFGEATPVKNFILSKTNKGYMFFNNQKEQKNMQIQLHPTLANYSSHLRTSWYCCRPRLASGFSMERKS